MRGAGGRTASPDDAYGDDGGGGCKDHGEQHSLSDTQFALLNKGDLVNWDRLMLALNRTGANGRDVEIVRSTILRENLDMVASFQQLTGGDALLQNGRASAHGPQRRTSDEADN
jgi:hypothetical protein